MRIYERNSTTESCRHARDAKPNSNFGNHRGACGAHVACRNTEFGRCIVRSRDAVPNSRCIFRKAIDPSRSRHRRHLAFLLARSRQRIMPGRSCAFFVRIVRKNDVSDRYPHAACIDRRRIRNSSQTISHHRFVPSLQAVR